jgi:hypothetical protein
MVMGSAGKVAFGGVAAANDAALKKIPAHETYNFVSTARPL